MKIIRFVPFGELAPDARGVDTESLQISRGLLPLHGVYRSMAKLQEVTSHQTTWPINGSLAHLVTPERSNQSAQPIADLSLAEWDPYGDDTQAPPDADIAHAWWRLVSPIDEFQGIRLRDVTLDTTPRHAEFDLSEDLLYPNIDTGHLLKMRYRVPHGSSLDDWIIRLKLDESPATAVAQVEVNQTNNPDSDGWETVEYELDPAEVTGITDWSNLQLTVEGIIDYPATVLPLAVPLVAIVNEAPEEWEKVGVEDEVDKYVLLQDEDDLTYIKQGGIGTKSFEGLLFDVVEPEDLMAPGTDWSLFASLGCPDVDIDFTITLLELGVEIESFDGTVVAGGITPITYTLTEAELANITDYKTLSVRLEITSAGAGAPLTIRPDSTKQQDDEWIPVGDSEIWEVVSDEDNGTWAETPFEFTGGDLKFKVGIPEPTIHPDDGALVSVYAKVDLSGGRNDYKIKFGSGSTTHFTVLEKRIKAQTLVASASPEDVDWTDAWVEVINEKANTDPRQSWVSEIWVETEEPTTEFEAQVAEIGMKSPTEIAAMEVAFIEYDLPVSVPVTPGDRAMIYAGNQNALYEVSEASGFQDVSKTADLSYGATAFSPTSWQFASWGNRVIATNGADPIQYQELPGERFVDLLDLAEEAETEIFECRFLAVARDQLFCANIRHPDFSEVGEFLVWWSAINNPRLMKQLDLTTMSDYQPLVTTAGAITGMTGGEFITIWKRGSIYQATFMGPPFFWDMRLISQLEGTMYSNSIVSVDRDHFFFGNGGFRHLPFGSGVRPIGDGKITKFFIDKLYEDLSLKQFYTEDLRQIENSLIGTYDPWTRLVFWKYRGIEDNAYENKLAIVYNPWEDRWSHLDISRPQIFAALGRPQGTPYPLNTSGYSHINALPVLPSDDRTMTRSIFAFAKGPDSVTLERSLSDEHYPIHLQTKKMSSQGLAGASKILRMHGIRVIADTEDAIGEVNFAIPVISGTMVGAMDYQFSMSRVQAEISTALDNLDDNGWLMFDEPLPGEYFALDLDYAELEDELLREIVGFEVIIEAGSDN